MARANRGGPTGIIAATAGGVVALAGAAALTPVQGPLPFLVLAGLMGLAGSGYLIWHLDPAWTIMGAICLSVFGGSWTQIGLPASLPIPPDRLLLVAGVAALLLRAPAAKARPTIKLWPIHWLLAVTLLYAATSALIADTLLTNDGFFRLFDRFGVAAFGMFLLAPALFRGSRRRNIFLGGLVAVGAYLGLTALFETIGPAALVIPKYILNPNLGIHADRARGPFLEAEANGIALYFCGVAAVLAYAAWGHRPALRTATAAIAALCASGCLFTLQRAVWIGALAATIVTLLAFRELRRFVLPAAGVAATLVVGAFLFIPGFAGKAEQRAGNQQSLWDRTNLTSAAVRMVEARPLLGFGWGRFPDTSPPYFQQDPNVPLTAVGPDSCSTTSPTISGIIPPCTQVAHNSYLSNAAELGLVGSVLWCLSFILAIGGAIWRRGPPEWRPWRAGLLAIALMWGVVVFFTPLEGPFSPVVLWAWAGIVWASGRPVVGYLGGVSATG